MEHILDLRSKRSEIAVAPSMLCTGCPVIRTRRCRRRCTRGSTPDLEHRGAILELRYQDAASEADAGVD